MDSSIISPWNRPQPPRPPPPILAVVLTNLYAGCAASPAGGALGVLDAAAGAGAGSEAAESARGEGGGVFGGVSEVPSEEEEGEEEPKPSKERCAAVALSPLAARLIRPVAANSWPGEAVADADVIASGAAPLRRRAPGGGRGGWQAEGVAGARAGSGAGVIDQR